MSLNIIITGYYNKNNLGDDLFLELAKKIFNKFNHLNCRYINLDSIGTENIEETCNFTDRVILFGGETINDYFLDKLIYIREYAITNLKKYIPIYGIGVSCNSDYNYIQFKADIFDFIILRNCKDYDFFLPRFTKNNCKYIPDIVFLKKKIVSYNFWSKPTNKRVGFFLSQTAVSNLTYQQTETYYKSIIAIMNYWIYKGRNVCLFPMCCGDNKSEDDRIINNAIFEKLTSKERQNVIVISNNNEIIEHMQNLEFSVCWRFHAHVLSITYEIPFISISKTPKVINLLNDSKLDDLIYHDKNLVQGINYIITNRTIIKERLAVLYQSNLKQCVLYKNPNIYLNFQKYNSPFYVNIHSKFNHIYSQIKLKYLYNMTANDYQFNASLLLYLILGYTKSSYQWGLAQKLQTGARIEDMVNDIKWLILEEMKSCGKSTYYKLLDYLGVGSIVYHLHNERCINIYQYQQNDMKDVHRSGWQYVIEGIDEQLATFDPRATFCDLYLDRTFHWNYDLNSKLGIIPYNKFWIGFIHHTTLTEYTNYNVIEMFKKPNFVESLKYCRGLFVLSQYLQESINKIIDAMQLNIIVEKLYHPTEFILEKNCFTISKFINNKKRKIIQIGAWYRDINYIYKLNLGNNILGLEKCALIGTNMEGHYNSVECNEQISRDKVVREKIISYSEVTLIKKVQNFEYDILLSENIVSIYLIDCSAANTIIECIVRNTPILINKLPAIIEYLGKDYPLYYDNLMDASNKANNIDIIKKAHLYLKSMDKTKLKLETFINDIKMSKIYKNINL
jgi:polysaccharide pyruvyl transferase WcaK-like protein